MTQEQTKKKKKQENTKSFCKSLIGITVSGGCAPAPPPCKKKRRKKQARRAAALRAPGGARPAPRLDPRRVKRSEAKCGALRRAGATRRRRFKMLRVLERKKQIDALRYSKCYYFPSRLFVRAVLLLTRTNAILIGLVVLVFSCRSLLRVP